MHKNFRWFNFNQAAIFSITLIGILVLGNFLCSPANAYPLNVVGTSRPQTSLLIAKLPTLEEIQNSLQSFAEETQASLEKDLKEANEALQNLPGKLEQAVVSMNAADRELTRKSYAEAQKKLEESAKAYEERAAKADQFEQELLKSAQETRNSMRANLETSKAELERNINRDIANLEQSFKDTSEAFSILAEDTKKANQDTSDFLKQRIEEHTAALDRAMKKSEDSLKALFNQA
ncbi:MAG: hypothetical protein QNJ72_26750 [Pleurocapsa sp. MO_226.B13]|nr:hypothetical protein [Pleurocapsa sp. MO_226.B13]